MELARGAVVKNAVTGAIFSVIAAGSAQGATVLDVLGPRDGIFSLGPTAQYYGAGVVFEVHEDLDNVGMTIELNCLLPPCSGEVYLTRNDVIDGISIASLEDGAFFTGGGTQSFFGAGLSLAAGVYSLSLSMREGFGGWWGTTAPEVQGDGRVSYLRDGFLTSFVNGFPPSGLWTENGVYETGLTITADSDVPSEVPLPAGGLLLLSGLALLARRSLAR